MRYRVDYYLHNRWVAWSCYDTKVEAEEVASEHKRVYGYITRIVEVI